MQKTSSIISTIELNRLINITLCDETRHYFGGYFHVKVLAFCDVPLLEEFFDSHDAFLDARNRMGESIRFERVLEKMAVPENETEAVCGQLVLAFKATALAYLAAPDFAGRFVRGAYQKCINQPLKRSFSSA